ncbi:MAG TPA: YCF48-related protein [Ignavibacteria bacterium]|nr:YCF48-related protein [Ignavibacteria bacterium]
MKKINLTLILFLLTCLYSKAQWFTQQSGTTNPLYDIEFINDKTGWVCGVGVILKTTNGGANWVDFLNDAPVKPYSAIFPVDTNVVYAVGYFRTFIKSTNGGVNWTIIENGNTGEGDYYSLFFLNQNTGWAGVNYANGIRGVRYTIDGGTNFIIGQTGIPRDLYFKDSLNGIGVGGLSYIYKTTDGGLNWNSFSLVFTGDFYRVSFINDNTGYTASHKAVYKTTNFGNSWDSIGYIPAIVTSISFSDDSVGYAGTAYAILKTTTGGREWLFQIATGVVYNIHSKGKDLIWTCGNAGRIWHTTNGGMSFINNISTSVPDDFELYQNYPNPFNGQTKIRFSINQRGNYRLEIFNSAGQKISDLFEKEINPGTYETGLNTEDFSSGVYFYRLTRNNKSEGKRFVLVK